MTEYEKPIVDITLVEEMISEHLGAGAVEITPLQGGNLSRVFSFNHEGHGYVIKFSDLEGAYQSEIFVSDLLSSQGIPFPRCIGHGKTGNLEYSILEKIEGRNLADFSAEEQRRRLPELIRILTRLNHIDLGGARGYGWIGASGDGAFPTWKDYWESVYAEDQTGSFWENWYALFHTSCLEKEVFDEVYSRLTAYSHFNEPHRYFIHGDFHQWNILSDGSRITGILDCNCAYGDFLVDLAILDRHMDGHNVVQAYQNHQEQAGIVIPDFNERLKGAYYFKGLDGLRFYAKMGWTDAYAYTRNFLLGLDKS
ncbi:phosphotransferase family protein [Paenibacillus sp. Y412MC10]|uniref:phosphotransferase family protein n=1 Tax=Geobacillus sp. (strain Y412MC10) TaxID=481743 RepID=UPI0011A7EA24|nr:aminoglycoside phosphotransferase family protein [Paenibacillus sp. Y412MC10]